MSVTKCITSDDIVIHLLDIQARDMRIESEEEDTRKIAYESNSESDDDEFKSRRKKKYVAQNFTQSKEFVIHLFGADETGRSIRCDVTGFRPTIYLRLPEDKTSQCTDTIKQYINSQGIPMGQLNIKRITKKIFYGFTANTFFPFLQIDVPSMTMFRNLRSLFLDENLNPKTRRALDGPMRGKTVEVFEANIDPMLRFIHTQNIKPCGWISIKGGKNSITEDSESGIVIECDYEQIVPTKGPRVSAPFLRASWDIECFSMTGDFPLAKRTWTKTAKDLINLASDASHVVSLIVNSIATGQNPPSTLPKRMTPIYCQLKKTFDNVSSKLLESDIQEQIQDVLNTQDDINSRVTTLEKILERNLKTLICLVGDPVIQIGTTLTRDTADSVERHLFVFPDCAPILDIVIHAYKTEKAMILAWFEWMVQRNPDILLGYNIFGFDESYLWHRAEELNLITSTSPIHQFTRLFVLGSEMKLEEKFLSSSALGDNRMYIWTAHGRLQIDLYHYIKRNNTLSSYKLDEVTKHFMSGKLKSQEYVSGKLTLTVAGAIKDVRVGRAVTLLDDTGETVSPKLVVEAVDGNKLVFNCDLTQDELAEMEDATKWVVVKDDISPQDIFRLHREGSKGRAVVGKYCVQDCDLVIELYKKLETFNNTMCMANVCSVPVSYIFTRGQGIKIESLIFKACRERDILIHVLSIPKQGLNGGGEDSFEGAIVLNPDPGFYSDSPIGVCDFASLYPSTIVSENISHDSLLWIKDFKYDGKLISHNWGSELYDNCEGYAYTDIEFDVWRPDPNDTRKHPVKIKCGRRICRYAQPLDGTKSTLPQITTWLLQAREAKKKEMKGEKDPERYALLDAEQLAYKLTGNSLYGQLGSGTFKIRLQALAASVTAYGRKQILFAKEAIEVFYGPGNPRCTARCTAKVVYGDTDSLFVAFNPKNPETGLRLEGREARQATIDITDEAGHFITKVLAAPHDFEFDKAFDPMLMFTKKRYAGNMYENNADDYVHKYMGIALKRRDNAPIVKTIFGGAMKMLLDKRDVSGAFKFVKDKCLELVEGKVSLGQLTVTKSLRADYANPQSIAHKVLADRIAQRDPGNAPAAGERIGYVYISAKSGQEASKLQGDRIETPLYVKEHKLIPDYRHYIEHQLQNPISQAFGLLLERIPGFTASLIHGCPSKPDIMDGSLEADKMLDGWLGFREAVAARLLFGDCLKKFETSSRRNAIINMFGVGAIIKTPSTAAIATIATTTSFKSGASGIDIEMQQRWSHVKRSPKLDSVIKQPVITQKTISSFLLDKMIIGDINKKKKATAAKKIKEQEQQQQQHQ
jgi:DNA polymerase elongation subunit (family B)